MFPRRILARGSRIFRIHPAHYGVWWFAQARSGRFDLSALETSGTCYFAEQPEGCFVEVFKEFFTVVPGTEVQIRRLTRIELPRALSVADCTAESARAWGITAEIHSSPDYIKTREWAAAFARSGFDGIRYFLRHDPAQRLTGIALFGPAGSPSGFPAGTSEPIDRDLIERVEARFGIHVL